MNLDAYCTVADAAKQAGVVESYVRRMLATGTLQGEKVGRAWLVRRESLARFVRIGRGPASKPAKRTAKKATARKPRQK